MAQNGESTMVVAFTSNIGLAKPDDTELAKNWVNSTKLQEDNNLIIIDQMDIPVTAYTPAFVAQTVNPDTGNGNRRGEYQDIQGIISGSFIIRMVDPGVGPGSGEYAIALPFVVDNVFHNVGTAFNATPGPFSVIGEGYIYDDSAVTTSGSVALDVVTVGGVSYVRLLTEAHTTPVKTSRLMRDAMPFTLATLDKVSGSFLYKKL